MYLFGMFLSFWYLIITLMLGLKELFINFLLNVMLSPFFHSCVLGQTKEKGEIIRQWAWFKILLLCGVSCSNTIS